MSSRPPRPSRPPPAAPVHDLTPIRAHYLKKSLIQLQFRKELADITNAPVDNTSTLAYLGPPFSPPPSGAHRLDLPFLTYIFRHLFLTFPFMATAPKDFYSHKLQPFVASLFSRNLSPTALLADFDDDADSDATAVSILTKLERNLAMFFTAGTKLAEPEQVVRLSQSDLDTLEKALKRRRAKHKDVFDVNIISVRAVTDKGRVRSRIHDEFIIRTRLSEHREVCVSRRYGDFRTLANELRKAHPDEIIPSPPAKDRTAVDISPPSPSHSSSTHQESCGQSPPIPGAYHSPPPTPRLSREKNRLTLRAYLHTLLAMPPLASSPVVRSFLLSSPINLTPAEKEDARYREEADRVRDEGREQFAREIGARVDALRSAVRSVKGELVGEDGLTHIFDVIKDTPDLRQLPQNYQAVIEWGRVSLASSLFQTCVASDDSSETFAGLKRIHGLMPYFVLKTALKISNPVGMIRGVLDIFLAQPFGGRSLLQRMFTSSMTEEIKSVTTYIQLVSEKIDDPYLCEKVRVFAYAPRDIQEFYRASAAAEDEHLLCAIMHGSEEPMLDATQLRRVQCAARMWDAWQRTRRRHSGDDDDDESAPNEEAWLFEDLRLLLRLYLRLRDREQLIALIFEGVTAELLKDIMTIFYAPLAQVYRAASIADSLGDVQNFLNDLIRTVEQTEDLSQTDPRKTVQAFIDLVSRHEQAFYTFVYNVHTKGAGLFESLMRWVERFFAVVRDGLGADADEGAAAATSVGVADAARKISLETLLPAGDDERAVVLEEVDRVARYHYALKVAHEERVRRRFERSQGGSRVGASADEADEEAQVLLQSVLSEIRLGGGMDGFFGMDTDELEEQDDDEDDESEEDSSEFETSSEEDESEDETISEESAPVRPPSTRLPPPISRVPTHLQQCFPHPPTPPRRSHTDTIPHPAAPSPPPRDSTPAQAQLRTRVSPPQAPPRARPHALPLRAAQSMTGLRERARDRAPLPALFEKPLPPLPPVRRPSSLEQVALNGRGPASSRPASASAPSGFRKEARKRPSGLEPPELEQIPLLLPVFVEMMRPLLRPRP